MFSYFHCNDHHFTVDRGVRSQNQTFRRQLYELRESDHPAPAAPGRRYATASVAGFSARRLPKQCTAAPRQMTVVGARGTGASCTLSPTLLTRLGASSSLCWATCAARICDLRGGASLPRTRDEGSASRESFALHGTGNGLAGALAIRGGGTEQGSTLRSTTLDGGLGALRDDLRWLWRRRAVAGDRLVSEARLARSPTAVRDRL
jgi:hypothetical protein